MQLRQGTFNATVFKRSTSAPFIDEMFHHSIANDQENSDFLVSTVLGIYPEIGKGATIPLNYYCKTYNRDKNLFEYKIIPFDPNNKWNLAIHYNLLRLDGIRAEAFAGQYNLATETVNNIRRY